MVVSYEEKTLILWDMKAGAQKATFTSDKVKDLNLYSIHFSCFYLPKRAKE